MFEIENIIKNIYKITSLILLILFFSSEAVSQGSSGDKAKYESGYIVNMPTAGLIPKSSLSVYSNIFENSGMFVEINASPFTNFMLGLSYGGTHILGNREITWQNLPGMILKIRIFDESLSFPAILIGFNSQGRGPYVSNLKRFQNLSAGFFLSASKCYSWKLGSIAFHGGINYSIEPSPSERIANYYAGLEQSIGNRGSVNLEYNATLDEKPGLILDKRGLLNLSLRYAFIQNLTIDFQFIDLFKHSVGGNGSIRRLGIEYIDEF